MGSVLDYHNKTKYCNKGSQTNFRFPSACKSSFHAILSSVKCTIAFCLKKQCRNLKILQETSWWASGKDSMFPVQGAHV